MHKAECKKTPHILSYPRSLKFQVREGIKAGEPSEQSNCLPLRSRVQRKTGMHEE